jgi:tRNA(fMet)-specific endonuclease VapC
MQYMLDTDSASYVIRRFPQSVLDTMEVKAVEKAALVISSITYSELRLGAERSAAAEKYHQLIDIFCERLNGVLAWDATAAEYFARLQASLLAAGTPVGDNDAMIAGHAQSTDSILVSNNQKHFGRVSGLTLENWVDT